MKSKHGGILFTKDNNILNLLKKYIINTKDSKNPLPSNENDFKWKRNTMYLYTLLLAIKIIRNFL